MDDPKVAAHIEEPTEGLAEGLAEGQNLDGEEAP